MATVFDVAAYVLQRCKKLHVSDLKDYINYVQAWSFIWTRKFLLQSGDVNSLSVFLDGKGYLEADLFSSVGSVENLTLQEKSDIDRVILFYHSYEGIQNFRVRTNLSSLDSSRELVEQLKVDVEKILIDNYRFLLIALDTLKLGDELKNNFNYLNSNAFLSTTTH